MKNGSLSLPRNMTNDEALKVKGLLPNGEFRIIFRFYNDRDDNIMTTSIFITQKVQLNEHDW